MSVTSFKEDILQPISQLELKQMQEICYQNLPQSIRGHHTLFHYNRWHNEFSEVELERKITAPSCRVKFYRPRNSDIKNCTFVSISDEEDYFVFPFTLQESGEELRECFEKTKRIKWNQRPWITSLPDKYLHTLDKIFETFKPVSLYPNYILQMSAEKAAKLDINLPDAVYISDLTKEHAGIVNETWEYKDSNTYTYIETLIELNGGLGMFTKSDNKLISWVLINDSFSPGCMFTLSEERRKGRGLELAKLMLKRIGEHYKMDILSFVLKTNAPSLKMCKKMGLEITDTCTWYHL